MGKKDAAGALFTKKMKETHTILLPNMLPYHNELLRAAFSACGYQLEVMTEETQLADYSLPYISGDYCLPAVLILGQMLATVGSGKYDTDRIAFMEPQTGGACRAGNYYNSMIQSLKKAGYSHIPVISLNASGNEKHEGFTITPRLLFAAVAAVCYGDLLMNLYQQVRPYEAEKGLAEAMLKKWEKLLAEDIRTRKGIARRKRKERYAQIVSDFTSIPMTKKKCRKVGITGEIYMKFSPVGNEHLEDFLQKYGCDYRMGGFVNYAIYVVDSEKENRRRQGAGSLVLNVFTKIMQYLIKLQEDIRSAILASDVFQPDAPFAQLKEMAEKVIDGGCNVGDGWLIAGEVADLVENGCDSILIVHPFGCLVSHVCERGIIKKLRALFPGVNIQTIEYDYDSSRTLRESRVLLGISSFE